MARDKDGQLIARNAASQRAFDLSVDKIRRNWNLEPLSAIPEVDGLRPSDLDDVSMDFVRYIAYLSECEMDVSTVQALMIKERDRRLESKDQHKEKDKRLKDGDVKAIYERHYLGRLRALERNGGTVYECDNAQEYWRESSQSQSHGGEDQKSVPSTWDSGEVRTLEGSSSGPSTPLLRSSHVTQPEKFDDVRISRKRREITDGHVSSPPTKRPKPLITASAQAMALQRPSSLRAKAISSGLQRVSPGHHFGPGVGDEAWEDRVITERVAREKSPAEEFVLFDVQLLRKPLELGKRSLTYQHDVSRPTISPLSDGPMEQLASKPATITVRTPRDPLHRMLDTITTGFTDNLFFLHGILRTYADVDTARARGEALDAAAADVLKSMNNFRKRVELISEGIVGLPSRAPLQSAPVTPDRPSKPPTTAGDQKPPGAVHGSDGVLVHSGSSPQSGGAHDDLHGEHCVREEQSMRTMPLENPLGRRTVKPSQGPDNGKTGATAVPRATYRELWEELFINPW